MMTPYQQMIFMNGQKAKKNELPRKSPYEHDKANELWYQGYDADPLSEELISIRDKEDILYQVGKLLDRKFPHYLFRMDDSENSTTSGKLVIDIVGPVEIGNDTDLT